MGALSSSHLLAPGIAALIASRFTVANKLSICFLVVLANDITRLRWEDHPTTVLVDTCAKMGKHTNLCVVETGLTCDNRRVLATNVMHGELDLVISQGSENL